MRNKLGAFAIGLAMALSILSGMPVFSDGMFTASAAAIAQDDDWKKEFDDICSRTGDSLSLTPDELKGLVGRCDALKPRIEKLDETQKKVYLKRLQKCRDLMAYVLESKAVR